MKADIGVIGLAVMGQNLARNMESRGSAVAVYNRSAERTRELMEGAGRGKRLVPASSIAEFAASLTRPRKIMIMVQAGKPVDEVISQLLPHLERGDMIIDGGNSWFQDTIRRVQAAQADGLLYLGAGISGGEEGALHGPSIMPGGHKAAYDAVSDMLRGISARVDGEPCCAYIGADGAGHYVKMVHNGIEYGLMEAYAEGFELLRASDYGLDLGPIAHLWNRGSVVRSWLLELAERAFAADPGLAGIKGWVEDSGEGRWTVAEAIDRAVPAEVLALALMSRFRSRQEDSFRDRVIAALRHEFGGHAVKKES